MASYDVNMWHPVELSLPAFHQFFSFYSGTIGNHSALTAWALIPFFFRMLVEGPLCPFVSRISMQQRYIWVGKLDPKWYLSLVRLTM